VKCHVHVLIVSITSGFISAVVVCIIMRNLHVAILMRILNICEHLLLVILFIITSPSCSLCLRRSFYSVCTRSIYLQRLPRILVKRCRVMRTTRGVDSCFPTFLFRRFMKYVLLIKGQLTMRHVLLHGIQNLRLLRQRQRSQLLRIECVIVL